jgi:hypothetical protein
MNSLQGNIVVGGEMFKSSLLIGAKIRDGSHSKVYEMKNTGETTNPMVIKVCNGNNEFF